MRRVADIEAEMSLAKDTYEQEIQKISKLSDQLQKDHELELKKAREEIL